LVGRREMKTSSIPLLIIGILFCGCVEIGPDINVEIGDSVDRTITYIDEGYVNEGEREEAFILQIEEDQTLIDMTITVIWIDEPDIQMIRNYRNSPEEVGIHLEEEGSFQELSVGTNNWGSPGTAILHHQDVGTTMEPGKGPRIIVISVEMIHSGDYYPAVGGGESDKIEDNGNDFFCNVTYKITTPIIG
jgi:hypothetical protein